MTENPYDRWWQIDATFSEALELPPEERAAFLQAACRDDPAMRREVEHLLAAHEASETYLDDPAEWLEAPLLPGLDATRETRAVEGRTIGPYRVLRALGRGGMGTVYLAERADGQFRQRVALKLIRNGLMTEDALRRFRLEREILARLQHPNIARLLDGGISEEGGPYFVMEYVEGRPITAYCDAHQKRIDERLALFRDVCKAVHYAHQNLVVHRDLTPNNILVTEDGTVKLLDFGIAKLLDAGSAQVTLPMTGQDVRLMTPEYASPEQVRGEVITTASDVYQLGVLLYELLTGQRPYRLPGRLLHEIERVICEEEPEKPSTAVTGASAEVDIEGVTRPTTPEGMSRARALSIERLRRRLSGDLDNIVLMALRKEPSRRYASAEQMGEDLRRHLVGLPVAARKDTLGYRAAKFIRRHRLGAASAVLITFLVLGFGIMMAVQARHIARERDRVQAEAEKAEQVADVLANLFRASRPQEARGDTLTAFDLLARGTEDVEALSDQPEVQAQMLNTLGWSYYNLGQYEEAEQLLRRGLAIRRRLFPKGHPDLAASLRTVGALLLARGRYDEAEPLLREALAIHRTLPEGDSVSVAELLDNLAVLYEHRGDYAKAEQVHREELALYLKTLDEDDPRITTTLNNLAFVLMREGHYDEALTRYRNVLARLRRAHQGDHPDIAHTLINLGTAYRRKGDYAAADTVYHEALDLARRVFGDEHPVVAATLNNLGVVLRHLDRFDEAETFYRDALAMRRRLLGDEHPAVTTTMNNLAVLYRTQGKYEAAESLFQEVINRQRHTLGVHPRTAASLHNLARLYQQTERFTEAERYYREALSMQQQKLAPDHPDIADTQLRLGEVLLEQGQLQEAEPILLESYRHSKARFGAEDRHMIEFLEPLIALYEAWDKPDEGAQYQTLLSAIAPDSLSSPDEP